MCIRDRPTGVSETVVQLRGSGAGVRHPAGPKGTVVPYPRSGGSGVGVGNPTGPKVHGTTYPPSDVAEA
eukprot:6485101-Prorocentrum_lima.AAC.1